MKRPAKPKVPPAGRRKGPTPPPSSGRGLGVRRALAGLTLLTTALVAHALLTLPSTEEVASLAVKRPRSTALIDARERESRAAHEPVRRIQTWVPMGDIAPELIAAVLASEDARFFLHEGVDLAQLKAALAQDLRARRFARGASTLTQQLAKNLWLSERKSPLRKLQEVVMARRLEEELSKERILELYLNEVEWGDGLYGCEAASRAYFGHRCRDLSLAEGATLAALLPAPRQLQPPRAPAALRAHALHVLQRIEDEHLAGRDSVTRAREELGRSAPGEVASLSPGA